MEKVIYEVPLCSLGNVALDIDSTASIGRYRLIDCIRYVKDGVLCIQEYSNIASEKYSAISYIWKGNPFDPSTLSTMFSVKGAEDADPLSIDVLRQACTASLQEGAGLLWLDRLCILQTSRDDKAWQIAHMNKIYRECKVCIVLPGGLAQLVSANEETNWIDRAWTLQEASTPQRVVVLFSWEYGTGEWVEPWPPNPVTGRVTEVVAGESALVPLQEILSTEVAYWKGQDGTISVRDISPRAAGSRTSSVESLISVLEARDPEERAQAIWGSALSRTSSHPVDMVFSIMGMFGVTLDRREFRKGDRIGATIALAQEILRLGGKPLWLTMSLQFAPSRFISTFPEFPEFDFDAPEKLLESSNDRRSDIPDDCDQYESSLDDEGLVKGLAYLPTISGPTKLVDMSSTPEMDDDGYLIITAKAAPAVFTRQVLNRRLVAELFINDRKDEDWDAPAGVKRVVSWADGKVWDIPSHDDDKLLSPSNLSNFQIPGHAYIVYFGVQGRYRTLGSDTYDYGKRNPLCAFIVEQHAPGIFHRSSPLKLDWERFWPSIDAWKEHTFAIGGPESLPPGTHRGRAVMSLEEGEFSVSTRRVSPDYTVIRSTTQEESNAVTETGGGRDGYRLEVFNTHTPPSGGASWFSRARDFTLGAYVKVSQYICAC